MLIKINYLLTIIIIVLLIITIFPIKLVNMDLLVVIMVKAMKEILWLN